MTGDEKANFTAKHILTLEDMRERVLGYVEDISEKTLERFYQAKGTFDAAQTMYSGVVNKFSLTEMGSVGTDGIGHLMDLSDTEITDLPFENTLSTVYHVGFFYVEKPSGIVINPRYGIPEYVSYVQSVGNTATPDNVAIYGGGIELVVDSVCCLGSTIISNAGRKILVWKVTPDVGAITEAIAIEECTVIWTGFANIIHTVAKLGQSVVDTVVDHYGVMLEGPLVTSDAALPFADCWYIGTVTGAGVGSAPTIFNVGAQNVFEFDPSDFSDITYREPTSGKLKILVNADVGEPVYSNQLETRNNGTIVFYVSKEGHCVSKDFNVLTGGYLALDSDYILKTVSNERRIEFTATAPASKIYYNITDGTTRIKAWGVEIATMKDTGLNLRAGTGLTVAYDATPTNKVISLGDANFRMDATDGFAQKHIYFDSTSYLAFYRGATPPSWHLVEGNVYCLNSTVRGTAVNQSFEVTANGAHSGGDYSPDFLIFLGDWATKRKMYMRDEATANQAILDFGNTDGGSSGNRIYFDRTSGELRFARNSVGFKLISGALCPDGAGFNLGHSTTTPFNRVYAVDLRASGLATAGESGFVTYTGNTSATISTGVGSVKMSNGNSADNSGWLTIYVGANARYIPYWTTPTP